MPDLPLAHLSASQIGMYQRCGRQYEFRYIKGLKEPPALKPTAGKAGHAGIEAHMRAKMRTGEDPEVNVMLDIFDASWNAQAPDIELQPEEDLGKTKDYIAWTLRQYHAEAAPNVTPRAIEQEFLLPLRVLDEVLPPIKGYIDLIKVPANGPATLDIDDTKFVLPGKGGRVYIKSQSDVDWSDQMTLYDMAMTAAGITADRIGLVSMVGPKFKDGDPIPAEMPKIVPIYRDERLMAPSVRSSMHSRLKLKIQAIVRAIRNGTFIPTNDPRTCSWCGFRKVCPDSLAKDDFLAQQIREENPA